MTHYVLLKFKPGTDLDAVEASVREKLDQLLPFLTDPVVFRNCVNRDSNADLMAVVQLDSSEHLNDYLTHPLHIQMSQDFKDALTARTSFDHN